MSQEGFEEYMKAHELDIELSQRLLDAFAGVESLEDPWRHLDGIRRIGANMLASFSEEETAAFMNMIHYFVPSVASMDIELTDANQLRSFLVGIGMAWRLVAEELARCTSTTEHTQEHVNASLTRMMIALEPTVRAAGVRAPAPKEDV